jgi:quercetin dioxygenase-like cupin family protein
MFSPHNCAQLVRLFSILLLTSTLPNAYALDQTDAIRVHTLLKTHNSWDGKALEYPKGQAEITGMIVEIAPGAETGWHLHAVPSFGMVLEGELEVQLKDGKTKHLKSGEALAEVVNTLHNGRNVGATPVKLIVFYAGAVGQKLSEKELSH